MQEQKAIPSLAVSADTTMAASSFARTCQAAHLLSRVLAHANSNVANLDRKSYYERALQLHRVLVPFHAVISQEFVNAENPRDAISRVSALGICLSAMVTLYSTHSCAELDDPRGVGIPEQLQVQQLSLDALLTVGSSACEYASNILQLLEAKGVDPAAGAFATEGLYQVARMYILYIRETNKIEEYSPKLDILTRCLRSIGQRLQVASKRILFLCSGSLVNPG